MFSTGEFHFPNEAAAEIAIETVKDFLVTDNNMERIIFNVFKDNDREIYEKMCILLQRANTVHLYCDIMSASEKNKLACSVSGEIIE